MKPRFSLARRKARELLRVANERKVPVNLERLAGVLGARIHYEPFDGQVSGMVHRQGDGLAIIGVNSTHSIGRQRFTIAHEIGHLILHKDESLHVDEKSPIGFRNEESSLATKAPEIEANQFAAELLMPVEHLAKEIKSISDDMGAEDAVIELANRFQVSEQAMTLRLTRLGVLA
jgi:Zn-dependent peptidase ImmA (M78 family)